jgi:MATE family multidrug resistance protein
MSEREVKSVPKMVMAIAQLAGPIAVVQLGLFVPLFIDLAVAGRTSALAGVGLGSELFTALVMFGTGTMLGLEPLVARSAGAGDQRAWPLLKAGLRVAAKLGLAGLVVSLAVSGLLVVSGLPDGIGPASAAYLSSRAPGLWAMLVVTGCRTYLQSLQRVRLVMMAVLGSNLVSLALDALLLHYWGDSAHQAEARVMIAFSIGAARTVVELVLAGALFVLARWARVGPDVEPDGSDAREVWRIGAPVGLHMTMIVGLLTLLAAVMAKLGEGPLGGHQIAATVLGGIYQVELAIAIATSIHVGFAVGASQQGSLRKLSGSGILLGWGLVVPLSVGLLLFNHQVARLFTDQAEAALNAEAFLSILAVVLLVDVTQCIASGALRGLGDTRTPFVVHLFSNWAIGAPAAFFLLQRFGGSGLWYGLGVGLGTAALVLTTRLWARTGRFA